MNTAAAQQVRSFDSAYLSAIHLSNRIEKNIPGSEPTTEARIQSWADSFQLLHERDGYSWGVIADALHWLQTDKLMGLGATHGEKFLELLVGILGEWKKSGGSAWRYDKG